MVEALDDVGVIATAGTVERMFTPGAAEVHRGRPVIRETGQRVILVRGCDHNHVGETVGGRVIGRDIVVEAAVAGGGSRR